MNKFIIATIVLILLAFGLFFWLQLQYKQYSPYKEQPSQAVPPPPQPQPSVQTPPSDTTASISRDLDTVDLGNLDQEFDAIDKNLQGL